MGAEVQGVPLDAGVAGARRDGDDAPRPFGAWIRHERELREISLHYVAARTKLPADRLREIESGAVALVRDGHGRATARALATAIGADPDEAVRRLEGADPHSAPRRPPALRPDLGPLALRVGLVALALAAAGLVAHLVLARNPTAATPPVVYRPDFVEELLDDLPEDSRVPAEVHDPELAKPPAGAPR